MQNEWHIDGAYYSASQNKATGGTLAVAPDGVIRFLPKSGASFYVGKFRDTKVTDRLGSIPRRLSFADGASFETPDNDAIDEIQRGLQSHTRLSGGLAIVHRLEQSWKLAVLSAIFALATGVLAYMYGVPAMAHVIANKLPEDILNETAQLQNKYLVENVLKPPHLSSAQMEAIEAEFNRLLALSESPYQYRLVFRHMPGNIANAFALPDGTIVMTDSLVKMATAPDQVTAVLAHEIGHVHERHAIRQVIEASALSVILLFVVGDTSGVADLLISAPAVAVMAANSRTHEREADDFAIELLDKADISPANLADILELMTAKCGERCEGGSFLATHPATSERAERLRAAE